jgi:hypothetical protein
MQFYDEHSLKLTLGTELEYESQCKRYCSISLGVKTTINERKKLYNIIP